MMKDIVLKGHEGKRDRISKMIQVIGSEAGKCKDTGKRHGQHIFFDDGDYCFVWITKTAIHCAFKGAKETGRTTG